MSIAYFSNQFSSSRGHGIARYAHELFHALRSIEGGPELVPVAAWSNREPDDLAELKSETGLRLLPWGRKLTPLAWTYLGFPKIESWLRNTDVGVVHAVSLGYPVATKKPFVVTVHDIGPLTHPEFFSEAPPWIMEAALKQCVRQAETIIAVSQATADELAEFVKKNYGTDPSKRIRVIHEGVGSRFFCEPDLEDLEVVRSLPMDETPFILSAGKISPRKNIQGVIRALGKLKNLVPHHLVVVGGDGWDFEQVKTEVEACGLADRIHFVGFVTDEQLRVLYRRASVYIHASLFEGFGLTVLEAMASECPVVTSNCSSLPEVAGGAALLVDPRDVDDIASAIEAICTDDTLAADLSRRGLARARNKSWEKCAEGVAEVYRSIC